jgi:cytoskeletal protein CcmA (bactofilin family)
MFKDSTSESTSLVSRDIEFEGEISGQENLHVDGRIKGVVKLHGDILIGSGGMVEADIEAENIIIQGQVNGNVIARQQLEIRSTGKLFGNCTARSIDIKEGAMFEGRSNMIRSRPAQPKPFPEAGQA